VRTRLNVRDCDAVLVLRGTDGSPGTELTLTVARDLGRPVLLSDGDVERALAWLGRLPVPADPDPDLGPGLGLDVAGPRESEEPGIHRRAHRFLVAVLARWAAT
jgi:hypothetical protein